MLRIKPIAPSLLLYSVRRTTERVKKKSLAKGSAIRIRPVFGATLLVLILNMSMSKKSLSAICKFFSYHKDSFLEAKNK